MIYKLVCAASDSFSRIYSKDNEEVLIAVDGGYDVLKKNNIKIDYYFGDKDSMSNPDIESDKIFEYNSIKDDSDFDLVINYLINEKNINNNDYIYVYNATGGRLDHYQAIINTLIKYYDYNITIFDDNNAIYISDLNMVFNARDYKYISFFSIEENTVITLSGMKYNIENYKLNIRDNLCLSNEIINEGKLITNKKVLVFQTK